MMTVYGKGERRKDDAASKGRLTMCAVDRWVRGTFSDLFHDFSFFPFRRRISSRPPAGTPAHPARAGREPLGSTLYHCMVIVAIRETFQM
jgi:hypothetical protein